MLCLEPSVEARLSGPGCALFVILLLLVYRAQKIPYARTQLVEGGPLNMRACNFSHGEVCVFFAGSRRFAP